MLVFTTILLNSRKSVLVLPQTNNQPGISNVEKDEHVGATFVRLFAESKSLSRDALEILSASWGVRTGNKLQFPHRKVSQVLL